MKRKLITLSVLCTILLIVVGAWFVTTAGNDRVNQRVDIGSSIASAFQTEEASKEINGLRITVNDVRTEASEDENKQIVIVDLTLENIGDTVHEFSMYKLTLMDNEGYAYNHGANVETKGILGGQLHPARINRGEVAFEVPIGTSYELVYTDHLRTGQVTWPLTIEAK
ncbi:DUF4352 domain-containing protein [Halalkalibacterium ligniniphilum]|uniref:DUF4352 domain-containing protein n=1 Tax=Halalkalibacterium ligniniphilum TaxID=1134413 RepID=UPI00034DAF3D|nr:DUF4352 domain-containing protein [Halalkalibacterium ligniniphilum]